MVDLRAAVYLNKQRKDSRWRETDASQNTFFLPATRMVAGKQKAGNMILPSQTLFIGVSDFDVP